MKDRFIERKLNSYVEAVKPKKNVLDAAILALRQKRQIKKPAAVPVYRPGRKRKVVIALCSVAASVLLIIGLIIAIREINFSSETLPQTYVLADLTYRTETIEQIESDTDILTMNTSGDRFTKGLLYFKDNECIVIIVSYRILGEGGLDEIVVIADLKGGLSDFEDFTKYRKTNIGGITVNFKETPENGEWYTEAYFKNAGIDYYIKITSPVQSGKEYISLLIQT